MSGDRIGAAMTMASSAVASVPVVGTAASLVLDGAQMAMQYTGMSGKLNSMFASNPPQSIAAHQMPSQSPMAIASMNKATEDYSRQMALIKENGIHGIARDMFSGSQSKIQMPSVQTPFEISVINRNTLENVSQNARYTEKLSDDLSNLVEIMRDAFDDKSKKVREK